MCEIATYAMLLSHGSRLTNRILEAGNPSVIEGSMLGEYVAYHPTFFNLESHKTLDSKTSLGVHQ